MMKWKDFLYRRSKKTTGAKAQVKLRRLDHKSGKGNEAIEMRILVISDSHGKMMM